MSILKSGIPIVLCLATALPCASSWAQDASSSCPSVSSVQRRIVDRADQGMESLRTFVGMTKVIYGIDMVDVRESLDAWRAAAECQKRLARAAARPQEVAKAASSGQ